MLLPSSLSIEPVKLWVSKCTDALLIGLNILLIFLIKSLSSNDKEINYIVSQGMYNIIIKGKILLLNY